MDNIEKEKILSVGDCYPSWQTGQDGFILEWGDTGFILYAMLNGISECEKKQFSVQSKLTICYTIIHDVCYFTFLFGEMPWADCPFSPALYKAVGEQAVFPEIEEKTGFGLTVLLIDTKTGQLCNIRLIGLGHDFSVNWKAWAQGVAEKNLTRAEYNAQIDKAYCDYASEDFATKARGEGNEYIVQG